MSLKNRYADEIASAMAKSLEDEAFLGQFTKEAASSHEDALREAISKGDRSECVSLYNAYFGGGEGDTALQAELGEKYGDDKAMEVTNELRGTLYKICNPGPGSTMPADDKCKKEADCQNCGDMDRETKVAVAFAMNHLVKVANALDNRGFAGVAGIVDEAVERLASKKKVKKADILDDLERGKPIDTGDYSMSAPTDMPVSVMERNISGLTGEYDEEGRLKEYDEDAEEKESEKEIAELEKQEKEWEAESDKMTDMNQAKGDRAQLLRWLEELDHDTSQYEDLSDEDLKDIIRESI